MAGQIRYMDQTIMGRHGVRLIPCRHDGTNVAPGGQKGNLVVVSAPLYEIIALAARYWFVALVAVIVLVSFAWMWQDRRVDHRRRAELPDAGMIGYLEVLAGSGELEVGTLISVPREGILGAIRGCDVSIPAPGVKAIHGDYEFLEGKGVLLRPRKGCTLTVDGITLAHRSDISAHPLPHHGVLTVGEVSLRLLLFAGIHEQADSALQSAPVPEIASTAPVAPLPPPTDAGLMMDPTDPSAAGYMPPAGWQEAPPMPLDAMGYPMDQGASYPPPDDPLFYPESGYMDQPDAHHYDAPPYPADEHSGQPIDPPIPPADPWAEGRDDHGP